MSGISNWWKSIALVVLVAAGQGAWAQKPVPAGADNTKVSSAVIREGVGSFASYLGKSGGASQGFILRKGEPLHAQLQAWAQSAGWELLWLPDFSWKVIGDVTNYKDMTDVTAAISDVIAVVREEGQPVRLSISDGNRIMEVISTDIVSNRGGDDE